MLWLNKRVKTQYNIIIQKFYFVMLWLHLEFKNLVIVFFGLKMMRRMKEAENGTPETLVFNQLPNSDYRQRTQFVLIESVLIRAACCKCVKEWDGIVLFCFLKSNFETNLHLTTVWSISIFKCCPIIYFPNGEVSNSSEVMIFKFMMEFHVKIKYIKK